MFGRYFMLECLSVRIEPVIGNSERASTSYARFAKDVKAGDRVLLADGAVEMRAIKTDGVSVRCEVLCGGEVGDNKGINLPGVQVSAPFGRYGVAADVLGLAEVEVA